MNFLGASYVHICTNNTIEAAWTIFPKNRQRAAGGRHVFRHCLAPRAVKNYGVIFAGGAEEPGRPGLTGIIRKDLRNAPTGISHASFNTHAYQGRSPSITRPDIRGLRPRPVLDWIAFQGEFRA